MLIYIFHFLFLVIYSVIYAISPKNKINRLIFLSISFFQTFLLYALRSYFVGTDTYAMVMDYVYSGMNLADKAPLYNIVKSCFRCIFPFEQGYMIMCGLFIIGGTSYYIYHNSKNIVLSVFLFFFLYFFFQSMNVARQFIAIVLIANGLVFIWEKRKLLACLLFLSALFVHSTAIMLTPLLSLLFIKNIKTQNIFFTCYCIGIVCYESLLNLFMSLFPIYTMYTESGMLFEAGQNRKILLTIFYMFLLLGAYIVYKKTKHKNSFQENQQWRFLLFCLLNTVLIGFLAFKSILLTRMEYYFSFTLILFIPLILSKFKNANKMMIQSAIYLIMLIPGIFQFMNNYGDIRPYLFFWE